ncbi:hypothetical protein LguiA_036728 [Lonicera macranthoides]
MGISFSSNRRRNNNYFHHQNPHPPSQLISSYTSPSEHPYPAQPPTYPYPAHPPPPPPPPPSLQPPLPPGPMYSAAYYSGGYNYINPMMGRSNLGPYYAYQNNGWPGIRPPVVAAPLPPVSYVDHQQAKNVNNDVNVHKDTLTLEVDEENPDHHLVSFVFDALFDGSITILYIAKEEQICQFVPLFPEVYVPVKVQFQKGHNQKFRQPSGTGIDLGFFDLADLSKPSPENAFPLVISAETLSPTNEDERSSDTSSSDVSPRMQITQAVIEKSDEGPFKARVVKQILWIDGFRYELHEIYGIGNSAEDFNDNDSGKECVICMTEPKDTAVLPCRHMCMCSECAKALRVQSNKCPICRQTIEELMEIMVDKVDQ